jgi:hypothetical protein
VDLGGMHCSGAHVSIISKLRQALELDPPGTPVKVRDHYQMSGDIDLALIDALELDIAMISGSSTMYGFPNTDHKPWRTFDGTPVLVPGLFNTEPDDQGRIFQYPGGDRRLPPSAVMPAGGFYFDAVIRQEPIDEANLNFMDNCEEFVLVPDEELEIIGRGVDDYSRNTDLALTINIPGAAFGDIALVPAPWLAHPKGIRDVEEWYVSTVTRRPYIHDVFAYQAEICIENIKRLYQAVGEKAQLANMDGADFGTQESQFCSPRAYAELYLPHVKKVNDFLHAHTPWKTIKHCCGACEPLIPKFIEAGYDVLNPVQCSARGMEPETLVEKYGDDIVFWGGGVDTQKTLPFGRPEEIIEQVEERCRIFSRKNGFIFNAIHVIQANTPIENVLAMFEGARRFIETSRA